MASSSMRRAFDDVVEKVARAVNGRFPEENACSPQENIMRMRDSMCIMLSGRDLQLEFPDDDLSPRFMFDHPSIDSMAKSLCGMCGCPYCCAKEDAQDASPPQTPVGATTARAPPDVAEFTQLTAGADEALKSGVLYDAAPASPGRFRRRTDGMQCALLPAAGAQRLQAVGVRAAVPRGAAGEFLIDVEPVSVGAYARFLNLTAPTQDVLLDWCLLPDCDERQCFQPLQLSDAGVWAPKPGVPERWPMFLVSWYGANAYSLWANGHDWLGYRDARSSFLPTEAQWEYAARGTSVKAFPWGDAPADPGLLQVSWGGENHEGVTLESLGFVDVNVEMGVSEFGLRHMAGNVWQWCRDAYDPKYYSSAEASMPDAWNDDSADDDYLRSDAAAAGSARRASRGRATAGGARRSPKAAAWASGASACAARRPATAAPRARQPAPCARSELFPEPRAPLCAAGVRATSSTPPRARAHARAPNGSVVVQIVLAGGVSETYFACVPGVSPPQCTPPGPRDRQGSYVA
eukprot:CAMPEP_0176284968 /NCGR_PEP_ID=MMETSP0121_2-20121125/52124_1 /TAXON_ID=160619 /ORGANISM="Kryptoperidinium foliaceum, Strain CCMP 1326" /LENGTH=518 /DNA_ID=CAMNT_0017625431 /DNA_START=46 /DNA_END=1600 /DNA_ORIENTATION=+